MNLKSKTSSKLDYYKKRLEDLRECLKSNLTKDALHYCNDEIVKAENNIEYYEEILKILEGKNNGKE